MTIDTDIKMNHVEKFKLIYHTVKYLKFKQIVYRFYYQLRPLRLNTQNAAPKRRVWIEAFNPLAWQPPSIIENEIDNDRFGFKLLGETHLIDDASAWQHPSRSKLWLYHLHYFDDLNAQRAGNRQRLHFKLINRWIDENPPLEGIAWQPYVLSLRIVNWIKYFSQIDDNTIESRWIDSLSYQAAALAKQIEYHILANHLFANAKALIFAGVFFDHRDRRASRWLTTGINLLERELNEQFLLDGGHYERSPMYHATVLWDVLDLIQLSRCSRDPLLNQLDDRLIEIAKRAMAWLAYMVHPDGQIAFFNDATYDMAPTYGDLARYCDLLKIDYQTNDPAPQLQYLQDSGYISMTLDPDGKCIASIAEKATDYQPGHAHADTLSFELSLFGQRVIVNSGISQYGDGPDRLYQRSTSAHNTVLINNENSSEVWSGFRLARRAKPFGMHTQINQQVFRFGAAHDGYHRLASKITHQRRWQYDNRSLTIIDQLQGVYQSAEARFHLHPDIIIESQQPDRVSLLLADKNRVLIRFQGEFQLEQIASHWHPRFKASIPNRCLIIRLRQQMLKTIINW